jgi:hypothetical protein
MAQNSVKPFILSSKASSTVNGTYAALNSPGFIQSPFFIRITNASNEDITVSYDGIHDHEYVSALTSFELPSQTNSQPNAHVALFPKNTIVYVKGTAGTGNITLSGYYV